MLVVPGVGISLFLGKSVPLFCNLVVLGNTFSKLVHATQIVLGDCMPLFSSKSVPLHPTGLRQVYRRLMQEFPQA